MNNPAERYTKEERKDIYIGMYNFFIQPMGRRYGFCKAFSSLLLCDAPDPYSQEFPNQFDFLPELAAIKPDTRVGNGYWFPLDEDNSIRIAILLTILHREYNWNPLMIS